MTDSAGNPLLIQLAEGETQKLPDGGSVTFEFPAEIEGIFELELEERAVPLAELQVNP